MAELIIPPHLRDKHRRGLRRYLNTGEASVLNRRLEMMALRRDGTKFSVELSITRISIADRPFFTGYVRDITDRKLAEEQQTLFINELNHRVKNTLAIIQSIAAQTLRETPEPTAFNAAFSARLAALARAHSLLTRGLWHGASLYDIVSAMLAPFCAEARQEALRINGQPILIKPNIAVTMTLVLHELATNAAKHGALTAAGGRVSVEWINTEGEPVDTIELRWIEQGGPPVEPPKKRGFGSRLIAASADQLGGEVAVEYKRQGVEAWFRLPLPEGEVSISRAGEPADT
jgi:two-component sensor histidine kinase